ncbi:unnamed protein product [Amoebophrya sp. A25]|nr:unnamed protein product [Amoebophrya sp. A25]|eukprot:GSA25T00024211001.1
MRCIAVPHLTPLIPDIDISFCSFLNSIEIVAALSQMIPRSSLQPCCVGIKKRVEKKKLQHLLFLHLILG